MNNIDTKEDFRNVNCSLEPLKFILAQTVWHQEIVEKIRNDPKKGLVIEDSAINAPCTNSGVADKLKIKQICEILSKILDQDNKAAFIKLLKFTKQSAVYLDDHDDGYSSIPTKYSYTLKNKTSMAKVICTFIF